MWPADPMSRNFAPQALAKSRARSIAQKGSFWLATTSVFHGSFWRGIGAQPASRSTQAGGKPGSETSMSGGATSSAPTTWEGEG